MCLYVFHLICYNCACLHTKHLECHGISDWLYAESKINYVSWWIPFNIVFLFNLLTLQFLNSLRFFLIPRYIEYTFTIWNLNSSSMLYSSNIILLEDILPRIIILIYEIYLYYWWIIIGSRSIEYEIHFCVNILLSYVFI